MLVAAATCVFHVEFEAVVLDELTLTVRKVPWGTSFP